MSIEDLSKDLAKDLFEYLKPLKTSITEYDLEVGLWSYFVKNIVPFTYDREYILKRLNALGYAPTETQLTEACLRISEKFLKTASPGLHELTEVEDAILFGSAIEQNMDELTEEQEKELREFGGPIINK